MLKMQNQIICGGGYFTGFTFYGIMDLKDFELYCYIFHGNTTEKILVALTGLPDS